MLRRARGVPDTSAELDDEVVPISLAGRAEGSSKTDAGNSSEGVAIDKTIEGWVGAGAEDDDDQTEVGSDQDEADSTEAVDFACRDKGLASASIVGSAVAKGSVDDEVAEATGAEDPEAPPETSALKPLLRKEP